MDVLSAEGELASSCLMAKGAAGGSGAPRLGLAAARSIRTTGAMSAVRGGTMPGTVTGTREEDDAGMYYLLVRLFGYTAVNIFMLFITYFVCYSHWGNASRRFVS